MGNRLSIRYDQHEILPFFSINSRKGSLTFHPRLTGQHRGSFQLVLINPREKVRVVERFTLKNLTLEAGAPLRIEGEMSGRRRVKVTVFHNDTALEERTIFLPPAVPVLPGLAAGILAALLLIFTPWMIENAKAVSPARGAPAESPERTEPAGPLPPLSPPQEAEAAPQAPPAVSETAPISPEEEPAPPSGEKTTPPTPGSPPIPTAPSTPLEEKVTFLPDSPILTSQAKAVLNAIPLSSPEGSLTLLLIRGHCALWGSEEGRLKLSIRRAEAVTDFLRRRGAQVVRETVITGVGATMPLTRDPDRQEINRRVEIKITYQ